MTLYGPFARTMRFYVDAGDVRELPKGRTPGEYFRDYRFGSPRKGAFVEAAEKGDVIAFVEMPAKLGTRPLSARGEGRGQE